MWIAKEVAVTQWALEVVITTSPYQSSVKDGNLGKYLVLSLVSCAIVWVWL